MDVVRWRAVFAQHFKATRRRRRRKEKGHSIVDLGAGNGSAARWICKQTSNISRQVHQHQPAAERKVENRHPDEQGLDGS
jgi:hypothetical protein